MKPTLTIKHRPNAANASTSISVSDGSKRRVKIWRRLNRSFKVLFLLAAIGTLLANARVIWLQNETNKIYRQQANIALDTEERELRAYLHVTPITFQVGKITPTSASCEIVNDGQTPASAIVVRSVLVIEPNPTTIDFSIEPIPESDPHRSYLASHSSYDFDTTYNGVLTKEQVEGIAKDSERFYLIGEMEYRDVFNLEHHMKFGFSVIGPQIKWADYGVPTKPFEIKYENVFNSNYEY
jgi:hypothetical protein